MGNSPGNKKAFDEINNLKGKIDNIYLFISDAVRWDYTLSELKKQGICFKTVSAGVHTPVSLPSILTGLYPNNHGFFQLGRDKMPPYLDSLMNIEGFDISFPGKINYPMWGKNDKKLEEMKSPFIYIEHDLGGHSPYNRETEKSSIEFYQEYLDKDTSKLRKKYSEGIRKSVDIFKERLSYIQHNFDSNTLVIFVSDHGELLGEYGGLLGHGWSIFPELVYTPTVLIHPELSQIEIKGKVFRHIDLYPTILDILGINRSQYIDGESILKTGFRNKGLTYHRRVKYSWQKDPLELSVWDYNGGYVFRKFNIKQKMQTFLKYSYMMMLEKNDIGLYLRSRLKRENTLQMYMDLLKIQKLFNNPTVKWNNPDFNQEQALQYIKKEIRDMKEKLKIKKALGKVI